jgi:hypothetical protein
MYQIVRLELDCRGHVTARQLLQPPYDLWEDAMALAEFDAARATTDMTQKRPAGGHERMVGTTTLRSNGHDADRNHGHRDPRPFSPASVRPLRRPGQPIA